MSESKISDGELFELCEDCFVSVKEACMKLQEKTKCSNNVIVKMLENVADFYKQKKKDNS